MTRRSALTSTNEAQTETPSTDLKIKTESGKDMNASYYKKYII